MVNQRKEKKFYFVNGYDEKIGHINGDTWARSPEQAASFVAVRNKVQGRYRLRVFIDNADVVLITKTLPNSSNPINKEKGSKPKQLVLF